MKVADVMATQVDFVTTKTKVKDVCQLIFGRGINGVPVCKGRKVIGFVTERDILAKFYPSMQEFVEDPVHMANFEEMEKKASEIFALKAEEIMSKNPTTVTPETHLLRAQSLMFVQKVGRLPVIDEKGNIVGMIAKGDIFRALVGDKLPMTSDEEYHDWLSKHYDLVVKWEKRLGSEMPDLIKLFREEKIDSILDIGFGTGEHDIALAKEGFRVVGVENSPLMYQSAEKKFKELPEYIARKLRFIHGDYPNVLRNHQQEFGAAIFMGNAFAHLTNDYEKVLKAVCQSLYPKKSLIVMQILNFEKIFKVKKRFRDFNFAQSRLGVPHEHVFLEFYSPSRGKKDPLTLTMAILDGDGKNWRFRSVNSTPIVDLNKEKIKTLFKKNGFKRISFYGAMFLGPLFRHSFKPLENDYLIVVAKR